MCVYIDRKKNDRYKKTEDFSLFKNGRNPFSERMLEVFGNQYEDMMKEQSRSNHRIFGYESSHRLDHPLIYRHIHQQRLLRHLHIDNHCCHDLKMNTGKNIIKQTKNICLPLKSYNA